MPKRRLDREERDLWSKVTRDVKPIAQPVDRRGAAKPSLREFAKALGEPLVLSAPTLPRKAPGKLKMTTAATVALSPEQSVTASGDPRQARHIRRGRRDIEATLDLHGMTQEQAFAALQHFIMMSKARQRRTLLVITGKGARETIYAPFSSVSRGVLRHRFLEWVDGPFRDQIARVSQAHQRHGGSGAFYVMLKKTG